MREPSSYKHPMCPRCGAEWVIDEDSHLDDYICADRCGMVVFELYGSRGEGYILDIGLYEIHWLIDGSCTIWVAGPRLVLKEPLSFTITEEQIKLYLTFS